MSKPLKIKGEFIKPVGLRESVGAFTEEEARADYQARDRSNPNCPRFRALLLKGAKVAGSLTQNLRDDYGLAGIFGADNSPGNPDLIDEYWGRFDEAVMQAVEAWDGVSIFGKPSKAQSDKGEKGFIYPFVDLKMRPYVRIEGDAERSDAMAGVDSHNYTGGAERHLSEAKTRNDDEHSPIPDHASGAVASASSMDAVGEHTAARGIIHGGFNPWGFTVNQLAVPEATARFESEHPAEAKLIAGVVKAGSKARYVDQQRPKKKYTQQVREEYAARIEGAFAVFRQVLKEQRRSIRRETPESYYARELSLPAEEPTQRDKPSKEATEAMEARKAQASAIEATARESAHIGAREAYAYGTEWMAIKTALPQPGSNARRRKITDVDLVALKNWCLEIAGRPGFAAVIPLHRAADFEDLDDGMVVSLDGRRGKISWAQAELAKAAERDRWRPLLTIYREELKAKAMLDQYAWWPNDEADPWHGDTDGEASKCVTVDQSNV